MLLRPRPAASRWASRVAISCSRPTSGTPPINADTVNALKAHWEVVVPYDCTILVRCRGSSIVLGHGPVTPLPEDCGRGRGCGPGPNPPERISFPARRGICLPRALPARSIAPVVWRYFYRGVYASRPPGKLMPFGLRDLAPGELEQLQPELSVVSAA